ncbi:hypothetical protein ERO13_A11G256700v2 [Gossypium hirsutum]|uniref:Uncharacterized protein n=3 Tax=Gossypium TaxID=3633 RepID=A0A2P5WTL1_GOSBA|nr:hypothetical protein ES319_A11G274500v1 [Gossypium barbadense]KAG4176611.1 hypothetical protein ERO13_A11G256700v2 [Gossypium hirsutum]PPR94408.1 hypothetical protein GOBAR_AA26259 [Gossypium barbadense]TYG95835.1 hypothetical protein ES288_A11G300000v1 [Gossypium darwinii]TYI02855.1 hypothetical protein ES332_A11G296500v1 [Gossypium tomentosum]
MASAGMKTMMIIWCAIMVMSYMVPGVMGTPFDCMSDCTKSCGSGFFCHVKCEFQCIKSNGAGFFHPVIRNKATKNSCGSSASLSALSSPSCQPRGSERKIKPIIN